MQNFNDYIEEKAKLNVKMTKKSEGLYTLNDRQVQLLKYMNGDETGKTTSTIHMNLNSISKKTAIKDLKGLLNSGFLRSKKQGKYLYYYGTDKVKELFE